MNNKGFSTIELLVSFLIITFIAIAMFKTVLDLLDKVQYYQGSSKMIILNGNLVNSIQKDLYQKKFYGSNRCGCNCYDITFQDLSVRRIKLDSESKTIQYGGITEKIPASASLSGNLQFSKTTYTSEIGKNDTILKIRIPMLNLDNNKSQNINVLYQYDSRVMGDLPPFVEIPFDDGAC